MAKSAIWNANHKTTHGVAIETINDPNELIKFLTGNNTFTYPRTTSDKEFNKIVEGYYAYLKREGLSLNSLPVEVAESNLIAPDTLFEKDGRQLSAMFLLHLCVALRIKKHTKNIETVLEIGGGYGNLARIMRLFNPQIKYVIVDLLDSLYCSYVFLRTHFRDASFIFVTQNNNNIDGYDFVFVPTEFFDSITNSFDIVVNTCSLGEMQQNEVNSYMKFINTNARYFYSVNRFGPSNPYTSPDQANVSVILNPNWDILVWDVFGETGFSQIEPIGPPHLELLAERLPKQDSYRLPAQSLLLLAREMKVGSSAWHYCMWNSIRLSPTKEAIWDYLKVIESLGFRDAAYYRELYQTADDMASGPAGVSFKKKSSFIQRRLYQLANLL